jgi:muramoyltetrapeptide carboxypeptidase
MKLTVPENLKPGDTIGFISPSAGLAGLVPHRITQAVRIFEELGYKVKIAQHALQNSGYVSSSVEERVSDIHEMFLDSEVKMIMCTLGGNNCNQLLRHLDYRLIRQHPKIFIGYSDITVLHYAIASQAGLATYYGPCAMTQFGEYPRVLEYTLEYFRKELDSTVPKFEYDVPASDVWTNELMDWFQKLDQTRPRELKSNSGYEWLVEGEAEGEALGGAILSVNHLAGTPYWIDPKGTIFFLDILKTTELNEGAVDAYLADLQNMGVFDVINGLVVSRPADYEPEETDRLKIMILQYVGNKKCPILFNANIGHTDPIMTLRYGRRVRIDSKRNAFKVH